MASKMGKSRNQEDLEEYLAQHKYYFEFCQNAEDFIYNYKVNLAGASVIIGYDDIGDQVADYFDKHHVDYLTRNCGDFTTNDLVDAAFQNAVASEPCILVLCDLDSLPPAKHSRLLDNINRMSSNRNLVATLALTENVDYLLTDKMKEVFALKVLQEAEHGN